MTDRELLELSARAAGYTLIEHYAGLPLIAAELNAAWNPLTDDGDAFRLAVKLRVDVCWNDNEGPWEVNAWPRKGMGAGEDGEPDPYAATRRAIVRAAAEIGKDMK